MSARWSRTTVRLSLGLTAWIISDMVLGASLSPIVWLLFIAALNAGGDVMDRHPNAWRSGAVGWLALGLGGAGLSMLLWIGQNLPGSLGFSTALLMGAMAAVFMGLLGHGMAIMLSGGSVRG